MASASAKFSVDKKPDSYEPYEFKLSDKFRKLAKEELREDDEIREQALTQLREWIAKHPYIRKCRTNANFLLRFLRFRKISIPQAQEAIEKYLVMRQAFPKWFQKLDCNDELMRSAIDDSVLVPLGQDDEGRKIIWFHLGNFNVEKLDAIAEFRYFILFLELMLEDEEFQIAGIRLWDDYSNSTMKHYGIWGIPDMKLLMDAVNRMIPFRLRAVHAIRLPKYAVAIANLLLSFATPKFKERVNCHNTVLESKKHFDQTLWPQEYGGAVDANQKLRELKKRFAERREAILALDDMEIDIEQYSSMQIHQSRWDRESAEIDGGIAGCFRKLNVD
ncbi:alpha-tocopherol transfer protein-like [Uranotaenia lowii]|uniref:alpha-tocopherol transfer protein-like n=1 Tax=Uranotaenia lowii TaxID=190385 RepID=UPI002478741E|nr:alpha-tocopherol transfer protein-like [Uranotaenia lowii]